MLYLYVPLKGKYRHIYDIFMTRCIECYFDAIFVNGDFSDEFSALDFDIFVAGNDENVINLKVVSVNEFASYW